MLQAEGNILITIQEHVRNSILTPFFIFITTLGDRGYLWIGFAFASLLLKRTRKVGVAVLIALCLSFLINNLILKNLIARARPYEAMKGLQILIPTPGDYSFPSGHTGSSFAAAIVIYCCLGKIFGIPALVLASFIGLSRLYIGVHYPSDILGGMISGSAIGYFVSYSIFPLLKM